MELLPAYQTEFYVSDCGYIVISQEHIECGLDAQFLISPDQAKTLLVLLPELIKEQESKWTGIYEPDDE